MLCQYCGKSIDDDSRFCKYCGGIQGDASLSNVGFEIENGELKRYHGSAPDVTFLPQ